MKRNKILSLLLSVAILGSTLPTAALADGTDSTGDKTVPGWVDENDGHPKQIQETFDFVKDNIAYSIVDGGVEVSPWYWEWEQHSCDQGHVEYVPCGSEYSNQDISIPVTVEYNSTTYNVLGIGDSAFWNATGYTVSFPNSEYFTYIGDQVFFQTSPKMESITIPASVTHIGKKSFALNEDSIPVTIPEDSKLAVIGDQAFANNSAITALDLPDTLTTIGSQAFSNCTSLTSITIPASVTTMETETFDGFYDPNANDGAGNVSFADGCIFRIQDGVFYDDENLIRVLDWQENVVVPEGIKYIGASAFDTRKVSNEATTLKSISFPSTLESIGKDAFWGNKSLEEVVIPESVTEIDNGAFQLCTGLKKVDVNANISALSSAIFNGCSSLTEVELPNTIRTIESQAFKGCKGLTDIILPTNLETIGNQAFFQCTALKAVVIPDGVTTISDQVFGNCKSIETVILPASVETVGKQAFQGAFNSKSATFIMLGDNPPSNFNENAFGTTTANRPNKEEFAVIVPDKAVTAYIQDDYILRDYLVDEAGEVKNGVTYGITMMDQTVKAAAEGETSNSVTFEAALPDGFTLTATSGNEGVATVNVSDNTITVTSVAQGETTISAEISFGDITLVSKTAKVTVLSADREPAVVVPADTSAKAELPSGATEVEKEVANNVAEALKPSTSGDGTENPGLTVESEVLSDAAHSVMVNNTVSAEDGKSALEKENVSVQNATVSIVVQPYLDVTVTDVKQTGSGESKSTTLTLDITPMYKKVATTAPVTTDPNAEIVLTAEGEKNPNAVELLNQGGKLTITESTKVSVPLPENLLTGDTAYIVHTKDNGRSYVYTGTIKDNVLTFTSKHGFSTFTISMEDPTAAKIGDTSYPTLQDALDEASDGAEIVLKKDALSGKLTTTKTVTLKNSTGGEITVTINGTPYTIAAGGTQSISYTRPSSGSGSGSGSSGDYIVSVDKTTHGKVTVSPSRVDKGDTVTITVKPDKGYELDELTVTGKNGDKIKLTEKDDNKFTFKMPGSKVTVEASFKLIEAEPENPFTDISKSDYFYDAVLWAVENGVTNGTSAATFSPDMVCTRAQMVTFLWRAAGSPAPTSTTSPFTDVSADAYYYDAVLWAAEKGITSGTTATTFSPDAVLTRGQTVTFLWRANGSPAVSGNSFGDVAAEAYYADAVAWAVKEGVTSGTGGNSFSPDAPCTRAQIVTFLYRALKK